ncbi:5-hydroxytryptamine receptor 3A-like [Engraulis encrasicolus]|uniref:5-hydroxytryptamine receptor 3A-like n=1 Tax=Engraulis encrasicolus TaxID=184585 RepID=UPI002FD07D85
MEANTGPETYFVYLHSDGTVHDWLPVRVVSSCNMDIYTFPFDTQNCSYTFNSYLHNADDIQLVLDQPIEAIIERTNNYMATKGEWILLNMTAYNDKKNGSDEWNHLVFNLILKRHPTLYVVNLLVPSCFLISLDLFSFVLPPQDVDRSAFKMTLILGYTVFLLLMNDLLPVTGNTIPLLNVFFSICLALMVASLLETIIITNVLHNSHNYPDVPRWLRFLVINLLARLVCLSRKTPDDKATLTERSVEAPPQRPDVTETELVHQEHFGSLQRDLRAIRHYMEKSAATQQVSEDWIHIAQVVDRFLFFIYLIFISTSFITILVMWTT